MILIILFYLLVIILLLSYKPKQHKPGARRRSGNQYNHIEETTNQYTHIAETANQYNHIAETENQYSHITETRNRFYNMCGGDRDLAHRLVDSQMAETEELRWKKAIYQLERDRG